ncbi:MAG: helix-turn-helix domain-containing protein [Gemmatimonadaceae bacterium]
MTALSLTRRFLETTRGRIVSLLRRGARTVEELATTIGLSDNAVRSHLSGLERDEIVRQEGVRRLPGAGKPAALYEIHPDAEALFSRAYAPVLTALLEEIAQQLPAERSDALLRAVGRRLAETMARPATGELDERLRAGAALLNALGGDATVELGEARSFIRGCATCPLSAAVSQRPELCVAVEALLAEVVGNAVLSRCEHGARPRCCFEVAPAA